MPPGESCLSKSAISSRILLSGADKVLLQESEVVRQDGRRVGPSQVIAGVETRGLRTGNQVRDDARVRFLRTVDHERGRRYGLELDRPGALHSAVDVRDRVVVRIPRVELSQHLLDP